LGLNVGRIDWFLILFAEIGAILTCSVYLYYSNTCAKTAFPKCNSFMISLIIIAILYFMDVFYFVDMSAKLKFFNGALSHVVFVFQLLIIAVLFVLSFRQKNGKEANLKSPKRRNLK
jgi:hypothetical protein